MSFTFTDSNGPPRLVCPRANRVLMGLSALQLSFILAPARVKPLCFTTWPSPFAFRPYDPLHRKARSRAFSLRPHASPHGLRHVSSPWSKSTSLAWSLVGWMVSAGLVEGSCVMPPTSTIRKMHVPLYLYWLQHIYQFSKHLNILSIVQFESFKRCGEWRHTLNACSRDKTLNAYSSSAYSSLSTSTLMHILNTYECRHTLLL